MGNDVRECTQRQAAVAKPVGKMFRLLNQEAIFESRNYAISVQAADATSFTLCATPNAGSVVVADGIFEIDNTGLRRWDRNNDGDFGDTDETSWDL